MMVMSANKIAGMTGWSPEEVAVIKATVAKNTTDSELAFFLSVAKSLGLNPFNKEVWCYKDHQNNLLVFTGRDGYLAQAQKSPFYNGLRSSEVCKNDVFTMDIFNNKITHEFGIAERGEIVGGYSVVFRKDGEPTIEYADFKVYYKGKKRSGDLIYSSPWNTTPAEMIKKVAEAHALKKAFGISGVQSVYDYDIDADKGTAIPIDHQIAAEPVDELTDRIVEKLDELVNGEDKDQAEEASIMKEICAEKVKKEEWTWDFAVSICEKIGVEYADLS